MHVAKMEKSEGMKEVGNPVVMQSPLNSVCVSLDKMIKEDDGLKIKIGRGSGLL